MISWILNAMLFVASGLFSGGALPQPTHADSQLNARSADAAHQRLAEIYERLNQLGLKRGDGVSSDHPMLVNGKPVVALFIGDWHNSAYQSHASALIKQLAQEFKIKTLLLEGESADPQSQQAAAVLAADFENAAKLTILPEAQRALFKIEDAEQQPGDYERGNYRSVLSPELSYPSVAYGIESRNSEDLYYQMLRIYYLLGVQLLDEATARPGGQSVISIDGKPISIGMAVMMSAHRELQYRYGAEFPSFFLDLTAANGTVESNGNRFKALVVTKADHQAKLAEYRDRLNRFFNNYDQRVRNFTHAHAIARFFREQPIGDEAADIVLVMDGAAHLFSNDKVAAGHPSVIKILATLGVSAGSTFAVAEDETVDVNIHPELGVVTAEIVKVAPKAASETK